jgi:pyruvate/2-oxoglutarate dehydrogenase complex dihydrolipoamide acyltransferase (E2) component
VVPAARRLAREHGIPLTDVPGSGPGGRITEADVRARIEPAPATSVRPLAGARAVIARRMLASLQSSAQYTLVRAVDVTELAHRHDNLGALGIDAFTPIINPPEVAILGVGRITDSPAPSDGGITWRKSMTLSLTLDHRGVDGAPAARFLAGVADRLQAPAALL